MNDKLLAGPILRRATSNRICVWIATRQRIEVVLEILNIAGETIGTSNPQQLYSECTQLGEHLFIYLLEARCPDGRQFPFDTTLFYQLSHHHEHDGKALWDLSALAYPPFDKPSFYVADELRSLLHGSCRKPHGGNENGDALRHGDRILEQTCDDPAQRPGLLLLTGDQIYADDVSISLLSMLRREAAALLGKDEWLPLAEASTTSSQETKHVAVSTIPLNGRELFLKGHGAGFSSNQSTNHLLSFGEYAAMYIYVLGNIPQWQPEEQWDRLNQEKIADVEDAKKNFYDQREPLKKFANSLSHVRRLLANIPTYMILDDHDVTDDWNITNMWYDKVRDSLLGRRVVANALAAYWAFQGCGNDPDIFPMDLKSAISQHLLRKTPQREIDERYDLHTWRHRRWGYSIPTNPPVIAIDSRTQRESTPNSYLPKLLDRYARDWLVVEWAKLKTDPRINNESCPLFIATTPVLGFSTVQFMQKFLLLAAKMLDNYQLIHKIEALLGQRDFLTRYVLRHADIESWAANSQSLLSLMKTLQQRMHLQQCTFLSGDVHYAFAAYGSYQNSNSTLQCWQLTCSSLKNSPTERHSRALKMADQLTQNDITHTYHARKSLPGPITKAQWEKWLPTFLTKKLWEVSITLVDSDDDGTKIFPDCKLGLVTFENGKPIRQTLLHDNKAVVLNLPDI